MYRNLKATLDYADNPDKTTAPEYLDEDLCAALRYAENDQNRIGYTVISGTEIILAASRATLLVMANDRESYHAVFDS